MTLGPAVLVVMSCAVQICVANTTVSWEQQFLAGDYPDYYEGQDPAFFVTSNNSAALRERLGLWPWPPSTGIPPEYTDVDVTRTNPAGLTKTDVGDTSETDATSLTIHETELPPPKRPISRTTTQYYEEKTTDVLRSLTSAETAPVTHTYTDESTLSLTDEDTLPNSLETITQHGQEAADDTRLSTTEAEVQYYVYVDETDAVSTVSQHLLATSSQHTATPTQTLPRVNYTITTRSQPPVDRVGITRGDDEEKTASTEGTRSRIQYTTRNQPPVVRAGQNTNNSQDKKGKNSTKDYNTQSTEESDCVPGPGRRSTLMNRTWTTMRTLQTTQHWRGFVFGKCFVCGLFDAGIPRNSFCADAFDHDMIKMTPVNPNRATLGRRMRMNCRFKDMFSWDIGHNLTNRNEMYGLWTGGCAVRWVDIAPMYTQRTCRSRIHVPVGRSYLSQVFARMETALNDTDNGCIASPNAIMVPITRGITLYGRVHVCVCSGNFCNRAPPPGGPRGALAAILLTLLAQQAV